MRENEDAAEGGRKVSLAMAAVLAISFAVGGAVGGAFIGPKLTSAAPVRSGGAEHGGEEAENDHAPKGMEGGHATAAQLFTLESLVVNPAGTAGTRFLIISLAMDVGGSTDPLKNNEARLRDVLLGALSRKSVEELSDIEQREALKQELLQAINGAVRGTTVQAIYFPQYVLQ